MKRAIQTMIVAFGLCAVSLSEAKTVRATELTSSVWAQIAAPRAEDVIVEFRKGDQLPVSLSAKGDLLETAQAGTAYVAVKRDFWLTMQKGQVFMSIDGSTFKPFKEVVGGGLQAGAGADENGGPANAINVIFEAYLK